MRETGGDTERTCEYGELHSSWTLRVFPPALQEGPRAKGPGSVSERSVPPEGTSGPNPSPLRGRWAARLGRASPWLVIAVAVVLHFPSLITGFLLDDYLHAAMLDGSFPGERAGWDLYNFVDDGNRSALLEAGLLPWWTHPELLIHFFRPLSSALITLDHAIFGPAPLPMHLHSLLWWIAVVLGARAMFRRVLTPRAAELATWIFALAPCHAMPLSWLANRDALLALAFGIWGLWAWLRYRAGEGAGWLALAVALFSLAFASGEYALCLAGYVLGHVLFVRDRSVRDRAVALASYVVPALGYLALRTSLHCGTDGSGFYTDPLRDPEPFLWLAPFRMATLFLDGWLSLHDETLQAAIPRWLVIAAALGLALLIGRVLWAQHGKGSNERARTLWLSLGSMVALVPVLAVVPATRLLGAAVLGIAPLVASLLDETWFPAATIERASLPNAQRRLAELTGAVALLLGFVHLAHGPITGALLSAHHLDSSERFAAQANTLAHLIDDDGEVAGGDVLVVRGLGGTHFIPFALQAGALPHRFALLGTSQHVLMIRTGERSIELLAPRDGGLFAWGEGNIYQDAGFLVQPGDTFPSPGMLVTVLEVEEGRTHAVRIDFDEPLDERVWVNELRREYVLAEIPPVGFGAPFDASPIELGPAD